METLPSVATYANVLQSPANPPEIRTKDSFAVQRIKRRWLQDWYGRRRQMLESQYYLWLRAHAHDRRTRPWTLEFMSHLMIERTAHAEQSPTMRARRRTELAQKWRRFSRQARSLAAPERY